MCHANQIVTWQKADLDSDGGELWLQRMQGYFVGVKAV